MQTNDRNHRNSNNVNCFSKVHTFKTPKRTDDGVGREETVASNSFDHAWSTSNSENHISPPLRDQLIYRPVNLKECSLPAVSASGEVVNLLPTLTPSKKNNSSFNIKFSKEPRFVPYEPYKAATSPILQVVNDRTKQAKLAKNVQPNVEDLINMKKLHVTKVDDLVDSNAKQNSDKFENCSQEIVEKQALQEEVSRLKKEKAELENQVKFQTQINSEIKKLLVAAVGEDIETRVQLLTEDKLHLAKRLLSTAQTLSTHQEQIEWLAGQCEVWRSKFLASSMLVEDLARWKAGLSQKLEESKDALKLLLEDHDEMRQHEFQTFINLSTLQEKFNLDVIVEENFERQMLSTDINTLATSNHHLSELLIAQLLHENVHKKPYELDPLNCSTNAEKKAEEVLSQPVLTIEHTDVACNAVMTGAALALSATSPHCSHCTGSVTTV